MPKIVTYEKKMESRLQNGLRGLGTLSVGLCVMFTFEILSKISFFVPKNLLTDYTMELERWIMWHWKKTIIYWWLWKYSKYLITFKSMLWFFKGNKLCYKYTWAGFLTTKCSFKIMNLRRSSYCQMKELIKNIKI